MDTTMTASPARPTRRPAGPRALVVGALVGFAVMYVYIQAALIKGVEMPLPIFSAVSLLLAALVAGRPVGGWRWAPLLGTAWGLLMAFGNLKLVAHHLAHPEDILPFASQLVLLALAAVAVVGGVAATAQGYRPAADRGLAGWMRLGLAAMAGLFVGAVLVAAVPRAGGAVQVAPAALAELPVVPLEVFRGGEIRVRAGELTALRLDNPDAAGHSFDVDELDVHLAMPSGGETLALFRAEAPGAYRFYCAPHYDKASGTGMHGTLIVEP